MRVICYFKISKPLWLLFFIVFSVLFMESVSAIDVIHNEVLSIEELEVSSNNCLNIHAVGGVGGTSWLDLEPICFTLTEQTLDNFQTQTVTLTSDFSGTIQINNELFFETSQSNLGVTQYKNGDLQEIIDNSLTSLQAKFHSSDNSKYFTGSILIRLNNVGSNNGSIIIDGVIIEDTSNEISLLKSNLNQLTNVHDSLSNEVSALKTWKQDIQSAIDILQDKIGNIFDSLTNYEIRIINLESNNSTVNQTTLPNYFKYLSSNDRKDMVCGYAKDSNLTEINDLGFDCKLSYKYSRSGKLNVNCKCEKVEE